jgi:hypothetical protein
VHKLVTDDQTAVAKTPHRNLNMLMANSPFDSVQHFPLLVPNVYVVVFGWVEIDPVS